MELYTPVKKLTGHCSFSRVLPNALFYSYVIINYKYRFYVRESKPDPTNSAALFQISEEKKTVSRNKKKVRIPGI